MRNWWHLLKEIVASIESVEKQSSASARWEPGKCGKEPATNNAEFLAEVYKESGEQIRNAERIRAGYLGAFTIAAGALFGLVAQSSSPENVRLLILIIGLLSMVGLIVTLLANSWATRAVERQRVITEYFVTTWMLARIAPAPRPLILRVASWVYTIPYLVFGPSAIAAFAWLGLAIENKPS